MIKTQVPLPFFLLYGPSTQGGPKCIIVTPQIGTLYSL